MNIVAAAPMARVRLSGPFPGGSVAVSVPWA